MAISCSSRSSRRGGGQQVAGDLLADELVVRLVVVERVDDVVAIAPGVRVGEVPRRAGRLAVAGDVEPVPAPAFAERGRGEQPVDDLLEGVGRRVVDEGVDLLGRRRQAGQVERDPADQRRAGRRRRPASGPSPRARPGRSGRCRRAARRRRATGGHLRLAQRLPGPVLLPELLVLRRSACRSTTGRVDLRPGGAVLDPLRQVGDLLGRELLLRRHLEVVVRRAGPPGSAGSSPARPGTTAGPPLAALEQAVAVVDAQAALGVGVGGMAVVAVVDQDGRTFFSKNSTVAASGVGGLAPPPPPATAQRGRSPARFGAVHGIVIESVLAGGDRSIA